VTGQILLLALLMVFSAFFSGAEASLFALSPLQARRLRNEKGLAARRVLALLGHPGRLLTTLLVGNTLVNVAFSVVGTAILIRLLGEAGVRWSIPLLTLLLLVTGEVTPKALAVNFPRLAAKTVAVPLSVLHVLLQPLTALFLAISQGILRILGVKEEIGRDGVERASAGEVREVLREVESEADVTQQEGRLVQKILELPGTTAEEVMTPRVDIVSAPIDMDREDLDRLVRATHHSRLPLYEGSVDQILGFLHVKEFLLFPGKHIRQLLRPVAYYPETTPINRIFYEMQRSRTGMVIVVNEFGETMGLITREDIVEEIVGEIYDEDEKAVPDVVTESDGVHLIRGGASLEELNERFGLNLPVEESVTLNGFLCELEGRIPKEGSSLAFGPAVFHVLEVSRHRVQTVRLELAAPGSRTEAESTRPS